MEIDAEDKSVREILDKEKYTIDFFQREYRWERKHVEQLIADFETAFLQDYGKDHERYAVQNYSRYYLGPIVLSKKGEEEDEGEKDEGEKDEGEKKLSIIDGQQRLTTLTLLLIYLNNLQEGRKETVDIENLIYSEKYGKKSFNLNVEERKECLQTLIEGEEYKPSGDNESVVNIVKRYEDIKEIFPENLIEDALPYFIDWLIENVNLVEIITYSDEDGYFIFETMNDRGLNLTSTEMLKGYLLSNLNDDEKKEKLNEQWRDNISDLHKIDKEEDLSFFKNWLRGRYATTLRSGSKGAANEDFEKIGTRFHNWVRDNKDKIGLQRLQDFIEFIEDHMQFYIDVYLKIKEAENNLIKDLEHLYYANQKGFTSLHYPLLLAPINTDDDAETINKKLNLVGRFIETFIVYRSVNHRTLSYSSIRYTMFNLVTDIRNTSIYGLAERLKEELKDQDEDLSGFYNFTLHSRNKSVTKLILARITRHIEKESNLTSSFEKYVDSSLDNPFEIEHIWANDYSRFKNEFSQRDEWENFRNKIGGLLLLPEDFNKSYGDLSYEKKLPEYAGRNLLAKSLHPSCYNHEPGFLKYKQRSKVNFKSHDEFNKKDLKERTELYKNIAEEIWGLDGFDEIVKN